MKKNNNLAIIPARGGSKRLPNKNTMLLGGMPLIVHSINYAKENNIDDIIVSTDDKNIKEIAIKYDVKVIDRPTHLATDISPTVDSLKHVLENIEESYENVILLQPTNPLRPKKLLKNAIKVFENGNYDSLMTVSRDEHKLGKIINNRFLPFNYKIGQRSQDLDPLYFEDGLLYITKVQTILKGVMVGEKNFPYIVNNPCSRVDIDTQTDFEYAEYLLRRHFE